ncbi:MAG: chromosome segregation protein SMC [Lachnospiraceae bacterium]|jgi:chromosome segregation protein|nr:chromosome segregation protein SMC [Lachnospiraceae bacterium]MCI9132815.1 chromosome segregation protein SMC [Lachnospiraceae bacterium]
MYLKSIEVQGFKSFANKILFEFHNGITGIVGPNGSGKSNVADAVRWVLGEQRIKQLRGGTMQDVIFAGTENRKPLSYAYVAITLDNSDHQLAVDYEEVTVARRIYRSGESEYLINGTACRLKDVNELFYDTGIGKEGYSIIGQGQIDRILSSKPEESRELFDEATGIVKFKRRKRTAQKKLEEEQQNLVRIQDILAELEKQLGPLERQSETAKKYLQKKEDLKTREVNVFILEVDRIGQQQRELEEKTRIARGDYEDTVRQYENTRVEYEQAEEKIGDLTTQLEVAREEHTQAGIRRQQLESQVELLKEQIHSVQANDVHLKERLASITRDQEEKSRERRKREQEKQELEEQGMKAADQALEAEDKLKQIRSRIEEVNGEIERGKNQIIGLLNDRASTKGKLQRYDAMQEQIQIRKAQVSQRLLQAKSQEEEILEQCAGYQEELDRISDRIRELEKQKAERENGIAGLQRDLSEYSQQMNVGQASYHRETSRLEALKNMTERYEGYGNSIRRVMECRERVPGILGVVADIIQVEKKYETAVETALRGSIQNIVTDTEETAKTMIAYLKEHKYGRATFLPLTSVSSRGGFTRKEVLGEKGIIGLASTLVQAEARYEGVVQSLLGRVLVADSIDAAIRIARKYGHSLSLVTLEGEYLSPGGSMTGGSFKNASNLLGRRRELEELSESIRLLREDLSRLQKKTEEAREKRTNLRTELEALGEQLQEQYLLQNTAQMNQDTARTQRENLMESLKSLAAEQQEMEQQVREIRGSQEQIDQELRESREQEEQQEKDVAHAQSRMAKLREEEMHYTQEAEAVHLEVSGLRQKLTFVEENLRRIQGEESKLQGEEEELRKNVEQGQGDIETRERGIETLKEELEKNQRQSQELSKSCESISLQKEKFLESQKSFFTRREELSERKNALDKELFRLNSQQEKLEELSENQMNYMWEEYELTYNAALPLRDPDLSDLPGLKKQIGALKEEIRKLGDVNVNAIEDFRQVSERYTFMDTQRKDLVTAEETLREIIAELDAGMRRQFQEQFANIRVEFDRAFKELFGGGKATLEINEEEDLLEAGIRIIAQPPGKKLQNMMQLSGGEKALTAIALLFAIQNLKPSPFCLLDEIEAALDDSNVGRFSKYLHKLTKNTQFIIITHRKGTMEAADRLYGITMQEKGVSALVSVNLIEEELDA